MIDFIVNLATSLGVRLLEAAVVLFVGVKLINWVQKIIRTSPKLDKMDASIRSFLRSVVTIGLYSLLLLSVASILGIPTTSFITILASCGVAVGLALQGALSNLAGGVMILLFKPFKVGDYVEVSGEAGVVSDITVVYTILKTVDNKVVTVPNGGLTNSVIKNYSTEPIRRVDLTFTTAYTNDMEKVKAIIEQVYAAHPLTLSDPAPFVRLAQQANCTQEYTARAWCNTGDYWTVYFDLTEQVKHALDANGIQVAVPQLDVHMDK